MQTMHLYRSAQQPGYFPLTKLHRITSVEKAMIEREPKFLYLVKTCLVQKRDQLVAQMYRLDYRMEEIKSVRSTIEQDNRLMFGGMIERLKSAEGHKTSILQHEMAGIQQDIEGINGIISQFTSLTNEGTSPLEFMVKAPTLRQNIEYILGRQIKTEIEIFPYDLPRELFTIRKQLEENNKLDNLCQMKDEVILDLSMRMRTVFKESVADLDRTANQEISSWASLTDKYMSELQEFQRVCHYCSVPLNEETVNTPCTVNIDKAMNLKCRSQT